MASNRFRLNATKREYISLSSPHRTNLLSTSSICLFGVAMHAWHAPLDELSAACHVQVMSADIQVSACSGTRLFVALLHVTDLRSWPSSVTFSWRKQTAGSTFLHDQLRTAFLHVFWPDCLKRHAGSSAQFGLNFERLQTLLKNFVPGCFDVRPSYRARLCDTLDLLTERCEMPVYYY